MIEDDNYLADVDYIPSSSIQSQIDKLIAEEKAQQKRTWSYYQKIRKEDPQKYVSMRGQMTSDAIALGDKFNDGDFVSRDY